MACAQGCRGIVEHLLAFSANVHMQNNVSTPFVICCWNLDFKSKGLGRAEILHESLSRPATENGIRCFHLADIPTR